jgi:nicotinate-nucleotide--dimethylbenzimidazole phosphoribosyltransferase
LVIEPARGRAKEAGTLNQRPEIRLSSSDSALPFDDIRALLAGMPGPDGNAAAAAQAREATLTKPPGSLGRMEEIAGWLAAWQGRSPPAVTKPLVAIFAGNHGVTAHGVSAYPAEVTRQM